MKEEAQMNSQPDMAHAELCSMRKCGHEGVDELLWITTDTGAFGNERDGPLFDWIKDHKDFMAKVRKFDTVVQAGGNCGMYARFYKNYFKEVYTFEPCPKNYYCLWHNCQGEGYHKYNVGLGENEEMLSISNTNTKNVGVHKLTNTPGDVQVVTIDSLNLQSCDLIHLDVEGYEDRALKGALQTIDKYKPVVILERQKGQEILLNRGYKLFKKLRMDSVYFHTEN